jgi:hypothetical protein
MSRKYVNEDVSAVGTKTDVIGVSFESYATSVTRSAHGANAPVLALM